MSEPVVVDPSADGSLTGPDNVDCDYGADEDGFSDNPDGAGAEAIYPSNVDKTSSLINHS